MAVANERRSGRAASRGRSSANGSGGAGGSNRAAAKGQSSRGRQSAATSKRSSTATRKRTQSRAASSGQRASGNGQAQADRRRQEHGAKDTITSIVVPVASATLGVAGGILLGRTALNRNRKVLGMPLPTKVDLTGVGQQIGEAGRQFGKLASEVRTVREKAEQIGKVLH